MYTMNKDHYLGYLAKRMQEAGAISAKTVPGAKLVLNYWIRTGRLKLRQKPYTKWSLVNDEEVAEIVQAFSVGGKGEWFAK